MKKYSISVTYKCNWNCPYCSRDTHNQETNFENAIKATHKVDNNSDVTITGGEPGLLTTDELLEIIKILKNKNCYVDINSNGEIFKHQKVINVIDSIYYHCSMNMELDDIINKDYKDKTFYVVVVTDNNIDNLEPFLEKHNDIDFIIHPAKEVPINGKIGESLSKKNILKLAIKYKNNIPEQFMILLDFEKTVCQAINLD